VFALALFFWAAPAAQSPDSSLTATFSALRSASARFRHDLTQASPQLVLARAAAVRAACSALADSLAPRLPRDSVARSELAALQRALGTCRRDWDSKGPRANADSLRAWGPYRLSQLDRALLRYQRARLSRGTASSP